MIKIFMLIITLFTFGCDLSSDSEKDNNNSNNGIVLSADPARYMKDGEWIECDIPAGADDVYTKSIFVEGDDVYVGGGIQRNYTLIAGYWRNGKWVECEQSEGTIIHNIYVSDGKVYAAGIRPDSRPNYWQDGSIKYITETGTGYLFNIKIIENVVYASGTLNGIPTLWINGSSRNFSKNGEIIKSGEILDFEVSDNKLYVICQGHDGYWEDDVFVEVEAPKQDRQLYITQIEVHSKSVYLGASYKESDESIVLIGCYYADGVWNELSEPNGTVNLDLRIKTMLFYDNSIYFTGEKTHIEDMTSDSLTGYWINTEWQNVDYRVTSMFIY